MSQLALCLDRDAAVRLDVRRGDALRCGGKAACLGELSARGYPVPPFLVLSVAVYEELLARDGFGPLVCARTREAAAAAPMRLVEIEREMAEAFASAALTTDTATALSTWLGQRPEPFAVRSSATNEDLAGATFAGQYNSFIGVSRSAVPASVLRCYASLFTARAALYRRRKGFDGIGAMAVLVQEMVAGDSAGVVFSRAPHRPDALLVECAPGNGEPVVSGTIAPNRYYVDRSTLVIEAVSERHSIDRRCIGEVANLALAIEAELGGSQDVEYAISQRGIHVLQARPAGA